MIKAFHTVYSDLKDNEMQKEIWIKIFLDKDKEEYIRVSNIYMKARLFNNNDRNIEINNKIYGTVFGKYCRTNFGSLINYLRSFYN